MSDNAEYVGNADPSVDGGGYNPLEFVVQQALNHVRTGQPVKIIRAPYDKNGSNITPGSAVPIGYVDVQPMVNQIDGKGQATKHGTVYRLSYYRYQGSFGAIISDPKAGDIGHMVISDRDTNQVKKTNDLSNPGSRRKFDMADGTFFGCIQDKEAPVQWVSFGNGNSILFHDKSGNEVLMDDHGIKLTDKVFGNTLQSTAQGWVANGATITLAGDVVTSDGKKLKTHRHNNVMTGGGKTNQPDNS